MADDFEVGGPLPEESTNRPFVIAAAVLGGIMLLSIVCLGLYALVLAPRQRAARATEGPDYNLEDNQRGASFSILGPTRSGRCPRGKTGQPPSRADRAGSCSPALSGHCAWARLQAALAATGGLARNHRERRTDPGL